MTGNFMVFVHADSVGWANLDDEAMDAALRDRAAAVDVTPIAGFSLIRADNITEAERFAALIPDAASAHITVRALMPLPGIPGVIPAVTTKAASHA